MTNKLPSKIEVSIGVNNCVHMKDAFEVDDKEMVERLKFYQQMKDLPGSLQEPDYEQRLEAAEEAIMDRYYDLLAIASEEGFYGLPTTGENIVKIAFIKSAVDSIE